MSSRVPIEADGPTVRLLALARAVAAQGSLPAASAKTLSGLVRSVRLYAEAGEGGLALSALGEIEAFGNELREAEVEVPLADALARHVERLRKPLAKV